MAIEFVPPSKVFQVAPKAPRERVQTSGYNIPGFRFATLTKTGGMATMFNFHPLPRKGFVYLEGQMQLGKIKRIALAFFQSFTGLKHGLFGFADALLKNFVRLTDSILLTECERVPYLKYQYYCEFSKALWDATFLFLRYFGFDFHYSYRAGLILATIFQNDDAYTTPAQDVLSETTKEELLKNPRKEILRLARIYQERSKAINGDGNSAGDRILSVAKALSLLLYIPKFKKAFRFALENVNFDWFQYDAWDWYWALTRKDYNSFGIPWEKRVPLINKMMLEQAQYENPGKNVRLEQEGNEISILVSDT